VRARDLAQPFPSVRTDTAALEAAKLLARHNLPGLIVLDERDRPSSVLPGTQVLRLAVPTYCQEDPALARVVDESHADVFWQELRGRTVAECLPDEPRTLPIVSPNANVLEIATLMARSHSPLVAVVDPVDGMLGAITLDYLLDEVLPT
jgi:CBS domain-containing protein